MSPENKFYEVSVAISEEDNKGRIKKNVVKYLIELFPRDNINILLDQYNETYGRYNE